jgi:hypothetical protein
MIDRQNCIYGIHSIASVFRWLFNAVDDCNRLRLIERIENMDSRGNDLRFAVPIDFKC